MRQLKPFGSDAVADNLEQRYSPDQPRDEKGGFGEGSGEKEGGAKTDKVTVYHGTSEEAAQSILKEGLKTGNNEVVYASDRNVALGYAAISTVDAPDDTHIGLVVIPDAVKAGLSQAYSSHYTTEPKTPVPPAKFISRVEIYKLGDIRANKEKVEPVKVLSRSARSNAEPVEVYAAIVFDESEE